MFIPQGHAAMGPFLEFALLLFNCTTKSIIYKEAIALWKFVKCYTYELFVSKMGPKCSCLVDFFTTSLPTTRAFKHAHCCSLLKLDVKLDLVIDHFT